MTRRNRCSRCGWLVNPEYLANGLCECCVTAVPLFDVEELSQAPDAGAVNPGEAAR